MYRFLLSYQFIHYQTDVWSLGCLLYELAVLRSPFKADGLNIYSLFQKISQGDYPPISTEYSEELRSLSTAMMSTKSEDRPDISSICEVARTMRIQTTEQAKLKRQSSTNIASSAAIATVGPGGASSHQIETPQMMIQPSGVQENDRERVGSAATVGSNDSMRVDKEGSQAQRIYNQGAVKAAPEYKSFQTNNSEKGSIGNYDDDDKGVYVDNIGEVNADKTASEPTYLQQFGPKVTAEASNNSKKQKYQNIGDGYAEDKTGSYSSLTNKANTVKDNGIGREASHYNDVVATTVSSFPSSSTSAVNAAVVVLPSQPEVYKRVKGGTAHSKQPHQPQKSSGLNNNNNSNSNNNDISSSSNQKSIANGKSKSNINSSGLPSTRDRPSSTRTTLNNNDNNNNNDINDNDDALSGFDDLQADQISRAAVEQKENQKV